MTPVEFDQEVDRAVLALTSKHFGDAVGAPEVLYHYTDAAGLDGILRGKTIRATHIDFMNDHGERHHTFGLLERVASMHPQYDTLRKLTGPMAERDVVREHGTFVACFSELADSLGQWRSYANDGLGFAIGLDARAAPSANDIGLKNDPFSDTFGPLLMRVVYDDEEKQQILREVIELGAGVRYSPKVRADRDCMAIAVNGARRLLSFCAMTFKLDAFEEEREWRLVWLGPFLWDGPRDPATPPTPELPLKFRMTKYGFAPYLDWPLAHENEPRLKGASPVRSVVLGPKHSDVTARTCEAFLRWNGYTDVPVARSRATYR